MTCEEEQIFSSVEPIVKKLKELAQSLSCEIPTSYGRDPNGYCSTIDEEYADVLRKYVNCGQIEKFGISVYDNDGTQCPYPEDSDEHNYWLIGYNEALDGYSRSFDL